MLSIDDERACEAAILCWREGELVAFPTETVYGLGGDAENDQAVASIFAAKGRPSFNPLILHLGDAALAERYAVVTPLAKSLMKNFWPGPLTLVLPRRADAPSSLLASAGMDTVALRVPGHERTRRLLHIFGRAVAAPSANRSGRISPTEAAHVEAEFRDRPLGPSLILNGGACTIGLESTVLDMVSPQPAILRPGAVLPITLKSILRNLRTQHESKGAILAPGMLASHYAPSLPVRLNVTRPKEDEAFLAFGPIRHTIGQWLNLSKDGNLTEAAANLFSYMRLLDDPAKASAIAVMPIPEVGLGVAINDRLRRAAVR